MKNIEGDILELRSSTNTLVARYIYDGWGKLLEVRDASGNTITSSTHIANLNVLRYRGYFYDAETKLYYLQSRYYDPQTQRFISPDEYISTGQGIIGHNMFAYCNNNPVDMIDMLGTDAVWIQEGNSVGPFGHAGLLVQNSLGEWFYFFWGPLKGSEFLAFLKFPVINGSYFIKIEGINTQLLKSNEGVKEIIKNNISNPDRWKNITDTYYFVGNYLDTYYFCKRIINSKWYDDEFWYNLYYNNCVQVSLKAMAQSNSKFNDPSYYSRFSPLGGCIPNNMRSSVFWIWLYEQPRYIAPYKCASYNRTHCYIIAF